MNLLSQFKDYLFSQDNKASNVTVKNYLSDINHFIRWFGTTYHKTFLPKDVTVQIINAYKSNLSETFSASSLNRHLSSLRKFFSFMKLEGIIVHSPFEQLAMNSQKLATDLWHIKDFKNHLYVYNASHLTIKNYLIDIKQFLSWAEAVTGAKMAVTAHEANVLNNINSQLIEEYKQRLLTQSNFSPSTINRKLSSLRKYLSWALEENLIPTFSLTTGNVEEQKAELNIPQAVKTPTVEAKQVAYQYSLFPPLRLFQKISNSTLFVLDQALTNPLARLFQKTDYAFWKIKGQPVFKKVKALKIPRAISSADILGIKNLPKELYAPLEISTKYFPWYKKAWFTLRYNRPKWYKTYHSYPITHYFHFAILIIFLTALTFGFYNAFFQKGNQAPILAAGPTAPPRILSFQGRLTDNNDTPITTPTALRFSIYDAQAPASSSADLLWQEEDQVSPDQDGIFSILLGNTLTPCTNALIPATGACQIPQALFATESALFLGVTVSNTPELTPRQPLATVAYATNSGTAAGNGAYHPGRTDSLHQYRFGA